MELDDYKSLKYPGTAGTTETEFECCIQDLYKNVDKTVKRSIKKSRTHIVLLISLAAIYLGLALTGELKSGLIYIASGFIAGAVYIFFRYQPIPDEYYYLTLKEFIAEAMKRLKYFSLADWLVITPVLIIIGIGGGIHLLSRLSHYTDAKGLVLVIWVIFYTALCIFGYFAGRKNWNQQHSSLLRYLQKFSDNL